MHGRRELQVVVYHCVAGAQLSKSLGVQMGEIGSRRTESAGRARVWTEERALSALCDPNAQGSHDCDGPMTFYASSPCTRTDGHPKSI